MSKNPNEFVLSYAHLGSNLLSRPIPAPRDFSAKEMTADQREMISRIAMSTFVAMANKGHTFEACLSSIYLTGLEHGVAGIRELDEEKANDKAHSGQQ